VENRRGNGFLLPLWEREGPGPERTRRSGRVRGRAALSTAPGETPHPTATPPPICAWIDKPLSIHRLRRPLRNPQGEKGRRGRRLTARFARRWRSAALRVTAQAARHPKGDAKHQTCLHGLRGQACHASTDQSACVLSYEKIFEYPESSAKSGTSTHHLSKYQPC
jgi:hypothetical protein